MLNPMDRIKDVYYVSPAHRLVFVYSFVAGWQINALFF